jgi:hypothetical protein
MFHINTFDRERPGKIGNTWGQSYSRTFVQYCPARILPQ